MKKAMTILIALGILVGLTVTSFAHGRNKSPNGSPAPSQQQRIRQGIRSDELTKGEVRKLEQEQRDINQEIRESRSDGIVTGAERRDIQQEQNQASRHIYCAKHNQRDRN